MKYDEHSNLDPYLYQLTMRAIPYSIWHYIISDAVAILTIKLINSYREKKKQ